MVHSAENVHMNTAWKQIFIVIGVLLGVALFTTDAYGFAHFPSTRFGLVQKSFTGEKNTSLAEVQVGYGATVTILTEGTFVVPYIQAGLFTTSGSQSFYDGSTERDLSFTLYHGEFQMGFQMYLIPRRKPGLNLYLKAGGIGGISYIGIAASETLTSIKRSDQAIGGGFVAGGGVEFVIGTTGTPWTLYAEFEYTSFTSTLLEKNFDLSGVNLALGLGW